MKIIKFKTKEVWKPVIGYEGSYECSNLGRIRSVERFDNNKHFLKGRIIKQHKDKLGYKKVTLSKDCKIKTHKAHRLIAKAFIPNTNNYPVINHIDKNPSNNSVSNLEWCTQKYNVEYSKNKKILQYTKEGLFIREWKNSVTIQKELGYDCSSISKCCKGKYNSMYGFKWCYKEEKAA